MATELRWILAALSVPLLVGIWWWSARRSRQSPGDAALREPTAASSATPERRTAAPDPASEMIDPPAGDSYAGSRDFGVPPFEPLSIRTADFDATPIEDPPMRADFHSGDDFDLGPPRARFAPAPRAAPMSSAAPTVSATPAMRAAPSISAASTVSAAPAMRAAPSIGAAPTVSAAPAMRAASSISSGPAVSATPATRAAPAINAGPTASAAPKAGGSAGQRIISIRLCALGDTRWAGSRLLDALEHHGLAYGRYQVFHRRHSDGRTLFCAASLVEPGTFDLARMPQEEYRGLTLFAVLPGPVEPLRTLDALIEAAGELAVTLQATLQDAGGLPLSQQRAESLREDVASFQAQLNMT